MTSGKPATTGLRTPRQLTRAHVATRSRVSKAAFYAHLWIGVLFTIALVVIAISGILLNHKRALGLMPDVAHEASASFERSLPLSQLADVALKAVAVPGQPAGTTADIERMDVRPRDGFVKVRMRNAGSTEVTVDLSTGNVLHVGPRGDVYLEKLHSGEAFGDGWVLLSDAAAVALLVTLVSGYWLWIAPRLKHAAMEERT